MRYGNDTLGNLDADAVCVKKTKAFREEFVRRHGSLICRELLGYDFSDPEQRKAAFAEGKVFELCPMLVLDAIDIVRQLEEE